MNGSRYTVDIERLVLAGVDLTPGQAEALRLQLASELQRLLASGARPIGASLPSLPPLDLNVAGAGAQVAAQLAQHIAQALPGGGRMGER